MVLDEVIESDFVEVRCRKDHNFNEKAGVKTSMMLTPTSKTAPIDGESDGDDDEEDSNQALLRGTQRRDAHKVHASKQKQSYWKNAPNRLSMD